MFRDLSVGMMVQGFYAWRIWVFGRSGFGTAGLRLFVKLICALITLVSDKPLDGAPTLTRVRFSFFDILKGGGADFDMFQLTLLSVGSSVAIPAIVSPLIPLIRFASAHSA